jgi:hypothetical protein
LKGNGKDRLTPSRKAQPLFFSRTKSLAFLCGFAWAAVFSFLIARK